MSKCYICNQGIRFKGLSVRHKIGQALTYAVTKPTCASCLIKLKYSNNSNIDEYVNNKVIQKIKATGKDPDQLVKQTVNNKKKMDKVFTTAEKLGVSKEETAKTIDQIKENVKNVKE